MNSISPLGLVSPAGVLSGLCAIAGQVTRVGIVVMGGHVDPRQVQDLFEQHWNGLVRFAWLLRAEDAEDAVSEAFARLLRRRAALRSPDSGLAFVRQTLVNLVRDQARRREVAGRRTPVPQVVIRCDPPADPMMAGAVERLPLRQREALVLRYWLDLDEREIAKAMGITAGSVKTHLARALATLRHATATKELR